MLQESVAQSKSPLNGVTSERNGKHIMEHREHLWIESLAVPVVVLDMTCSVAAWNRKASDKTGITEQQIIHKPLLSVIHGSSNEKLQTAMDEIQQGKESATCELQFDCSHHQQQQQQQQQQRAEEENEESNGNLRQRIQVQLYAHQGPAGEPTAVVCFLQDTPQNKVPSSSLSQSSSSSSSLLDSLLQSSDDQIFDSKQSNPPTTSDDMGTTKKENNDNDVLTISSSAAPIFILNSQGRLIEWSDKLTEITGYEKKDAIGKDFCQIFVAKPYQEQTKNLTMKCLDGQDSSIEIDVTTKTNQLRRMLISFVPHWNAKGDKVDGLVACVHDVTQKSQANNDNNDVEIRLTIDQSNTLFFGTDLNGVVNLWNSAIEEKTGISRKQSMDKNLINEFLVDPTTQKSFQDVLTMAYSGKTTSNFELEFPTESLDDVLYLSVNVSARRNIHNEIVGAVCIAQDVTEAAQHDCLIASMAHELRQLIDTANTPIFGIDTAGIINEWNDKIADITGYSGDEAFDKSLVAMFIDPELQPCVQEMMDNALRGRETSNFELEIRTKTNEARYLLLNTTTRRNSENNIVGVVCIAQDVTEASKHDRAVAAMANELRQLIDTANAPIFGIDRDGDVNEWNDKTAEITGYTKEEAFDCSLVETFIVPSMRDSVQDLLDNALQGRGTSNYELEFRTKSNEIRHLLVNATTRRDAENNVVGVVGVAQDVTEAVQRDRAVAGMALELRQLIDTANAPIFGIDIDGNVNEWNRRTSEITGYTKEEAFDEPLVETFIAPSMRDKVQEILDSALEGNETSNYELEFVSRDGEPRFLLVNATTRRDPENYVVGVVGVAQDVTEDRKHAQELREMQYLRASQEAKVETERNMTAYFAHELRNPLGAIDSALNAMPDDLPETARDLISGMQLCTGFMSSIMNNLLDVRKMEEGKMQLSKSPISLKKLLNGVHKMLLPSVRPGVQFIKQCRTRHKDWVLGDAHRIQQVMTNVITNAIKYTVTGSVSLIIEWEGDKVKFECIDTGPGIPKNEQEKLFQRFVQRGGAPGTGLGLAIAKHLVDLTGGSIRFDSDPTVKAGTSCVVLLPLPLCDAPETVVEEDTSLIEEKLSFLIIDDIKMNRMMLKRRIKKGIAPNSLITEAATGEEALEICGKEKFDVIVADQYMEEAGGVMVGTDVVFAMRRMRIDSVIIGCSGNDMGTQFIEAGADWVWQKPMPSNAKIIQDLRTSLSRKALQAAAAAAAAAVTAATTTR